jgi:hypothetical protein
MLLERWDIDSFDAILAVAHRGRGTQYTVSSTHSSRAPVQFMVHCSQLLLESDWPLSESSESLGLFYGSPKTELMHSMYAATWVSSTSPLSSQNNSSDDNVWMKGDSFYLNPPLLNDSFTFLLLRFLKQKHFAWQARNLVF